MRLTGCCIFAILWPANHSALDKPKSPRGMPVKTANVFKGVAGLLLTLPFSFSAHALDVADNGDLRASIAQALSGEQTLQDWRAYAQASMVPDFDWADRPVAPAPDLFSIALASSGQRRTVAGNGRLGVSFERSSSSLRGLGRGGNGGAFAPLKLTELAPTGLRQEIFSPGVIAQSRFGQVELGAVFAYQRFASWDFGAFSATEVGLGVMDDRGGQTESSFGQGVRVGLTGQLSDRVGYQFGYRSTIDMDAFNTYRGVYAQPGEFDLPATISARLGYQLTEKTTLSLGMEQVQYSDIDAFLSPSLPNRFLALLGDGTSPEFRWRDLTIYSAEWRWQPNEDNAFALRYSTRQQPSPSSPALRRALSSDYTNNNFAISYARRLLPGLHLGFSASYAPASYFLGYADPFIQGFDQGEQIEGELVLTALF